MSAIIGIADQAWKMTFKPRQDSLYFILRYGDGKL